ncbi:hypothetical protein [Enterococcus dongliensis]|uniref:hypothetical protein n=1 Tax=Enterococcus dongliensis TaxID=2559925 RepID=UPI00288D46E8|nr:hypothetical protein [Enterococcus dongliensis]MDT2614456.1 hypothetical protein [Enterococcus dongliensis]
MYINFQTNKTGLSKILAAKKSYSLVEADEQLKVFARNLPVTKKPNLVTWITVNKVDTKREGT